MKTRRLVVMAALSTLGLLVASALAASLPSADAQDRDQIARIAPPQPRLVAHEWGVWLLEQGRVAHVEELAAESPPFVFRSPQLPQQVVVQPPPPPGPPGPIVRPPPGQNLARKPVIFLHADRPTGVRVEVGFNGGEPWLYYPNASITPNGPTPGSRSIVFQGIVRPNAATNLQPVAAQHFWQDLRGAGGDLVTMADGTAERFLFYDGPVAFERSFQIAWQGSGAMVTPSSSETALWFVDRGRFTESVVHGTHATQVVAEGDMTFLRARLEGELRRRGLTGPEAGSLLETWRDTLFAAPNARAIYFVPRDAYDRMLPIQITPTPTELVRVGLVVEDLTPPRRVFPR